MKKLLFNACLLATASASLLFNTAAQASTVSELENLRETDTELFDVFNSTVNIESLALDEDTLPELFADSLQWDGISDNIDVFFINEGAAYRNQLLYSLNGGEQVTLFDDISSTESILKEDSGTMLLGDGKSISGLSGDVGIEFFVKADGAQNSNGNVYGADAAANADGLQHLVAREFQQGSDNWVLLGFEDLYGAHYSNGGNSDRDFNDVVVAVRGVTGNRKDVPEPMTAAGVLLVGALGLAQKRRQLAAS